MIQSGKDKSAPLNSALIGLNWSPLRCNVSNSSTSTPQEKSSDVRVPSTNEDIYGWNIILSGSILTFSDMSWISALLLGVYLNYISWNTTMCIVIGYFLGRTNQQYYDHRTHRNPFKLYTTTPTNSSNHSIESEDEEKRDDLTRKYLKSSLHSQRESGLEPCKIPKHIAIIMDGNRRYGKMKYGSATRGHWDGSKTLVDFAKWCLAEGIEIVTVYAFSTENWNRSAAEINSLMNIFCKYCQELGAEALEKGIKLKVLSTETDQVRNISRSILYYMYASLVCLIIVFHYFISFSSDTNGSRSKYCSYGRIYKTL
jgi:hypothetical protein